MTTQKKEPKTKPTHYLVLREVSEGVFHLVGDTETRGATAAISAKADEPGVYVAVPSSNWTKEGRAVEAPPPPKFVPVVPGQMTVDEVTVGPDGFPVDSVDAAEFGPRIDPPIGSESTPVPQDAPTGSPETI